MKKILCVMLAVSMLVELCACARMQTQETTLPHDIVLPTETVLTEINTKKLVEQGDTYAEADDLLSLAMAEICYVQALAQEPDNEELYAKRSELYLALGDEGKSIEILAEGAEKVESEQFQKEVQLKQEAWTEKVKDEITAEAEEAVEQGMPEDAIFSYSTALEINPDDVETLVARGDLYAQKTECMEEAAADYASALKIDPEQEALYIKLADVYTEQKQPEKAAEVLSQGIEVLDSEVLKEELIQQEVAKYTDEDLLQLVNDTIMDLYYFQWEFYNAKFFEVDQSDYIDYGAKNCWYAINDPRVSTMADVEKVWHERFSSDYPMPEQPFIKEINGQLYARFVGTGGMILNDNFEMISVYRREGTSALLYGFQNCYDWMSDQTYPVPFTYYMTYEDSTWKCSGYACYEDGAWDFSGWESRETTAADMPDPYEIDSPLITLPEETEPEYTEPELMESDVEWPSERPKNCIPDEQEVSCEELVRNSWGWHRGNSNGTSYDLWFMNDGTFYALGFNGISQEAGWYEYNGYELYLNGLKYIVDDDGFITPKPYFYVFGDKDKPFYRTIDRRERVRKLPQFMKDRYEQTPEETLPPDLPTTGLPDRLDLELHDAPYSELWSKMSDKMLEASASAINTQINCSSTREQMALFQELMCDRHFIKAMLSRKTIRSLCGQEFKDQYNGLIEKFGTESFWKDEAYQIAAAICLKAIKHNPHIIKAILNDIIYTYPKETLSSISNICKQQEAEKKISANLRFNIVLLEYYQKEYADYESIPEPEGTSAADKVTDFKGSYEYLKLHFPWYIQKITQLACQDVNHGSAAHSPVVDQLCTAAEQEKTNLVQSINECQTWSFRVFHREQNEQLESLKQEIRKLSTEFEKLYWIIAAHAINRQSVYLLETAPLQLSENEIAVLSMKSPASNAEWFREAELVSQYKDGTQVLSTMVSDNKLTALVKSGFSGTDHLVLKHDGNIVDTATVRVSGTYNGRMDRTAAYPYHGMQDVIPYVKSNGSLSNELRIDFPTEVYPGFGDIAIVERETGQLAETIKAADGICHGNQIQWRSSGPLKAGMEYYVLMSRGVAVSKKDPIDDSKLISDANVWTFKTAPLEAYDQTVTKEDILLKYPSFIQPFPLLEDVRETYRDVLYHSDNHHLASAVSWAFGNVGPLEWLELIDIMSGKNEEKAIMNLFMQASNQSDAGLQLAEHFQKLLDNPVVDSLDLEAEIDTDQLSKFFGNIFSCTEKEASDLTSDILKDKDLHKDLSALFKGQNLTIEIITTVGSYLYMREVKINLIDTLIEELEENNFENDVMYKELIEFRKEYMESSMTWQVAKKIILSPELIAVAEEVANMGYIEFAAKIVNKTGLIHVSEKLSGTAVFLISLPLKIYSYGYDQKHSTADETLDFYASSAYAGRLYWLLQHKKNKFMEGRAGKEQSGAVDDVKNFETLYILYCAALHETCETMIPILEKEGNYECGPTVNKLNRYLEKLEKHSTNSIFSYWKYCTDYANNYFEDIRKNIVYESNGGQKVPVRFKN